MAAPLDPEDGSNRLRLRGLKIVEPRPALVPLTLGGEEVLFRSLSGVSADVIARFGKTEFREAALFTHKGLSGPAILQISSYWRHGEIGIAAGPRDGSSRRNGRGRARTFIP